MLHNRSFGRCSVCDAADLEIDDGGYLYCAICGAKENPRGQFLPVRRAERDYTSFSSSFEQCPHCGERQTRRDSDDFLYCLPCQRLVVLPAPEAWYPPGALCQLGLRCEVRGTPGGPRPRTRTSAAAIT